MPYNIILYFRFPYFHVSNNSALFSTQYFSTLILYRRSLDTLYILYDICVREGGREGDGERDEERERWGGGVRERDRGTERRESASASNAHCLVYVKPPAKTRNCKCRKILSWVYNKTLGNSDEHIIWNLQPWRVYASNVITIFQLGFFNGLWAGFILH